MQMTPELMIDACNLHHAYSHGAMVEPVLHGINLRIRRGEFVVIMGPSGCGKTTLLNLLGLMMLPTQADRLEIAGVDTRHLSDAARTRLRREAIGFVFQRFNLLPTISAYRNVVLPLHLRGIQPDGQAAELIRRTGLQELVHKKPAQLSMGQQQRFAIARALVGRPALLLADEPTGNLDSANAEAVLSLLSEFHRDWGQTIVMITHNEHLTVAADRVLRMCDGRIIDGA
ncbi:MAG: ABC transporter ATP-binding protein [Phycisphaerae bacterium]|nr:ABC transporter ATP-binding protein [Phycisphaerae bacterium]